LNRLLTIANDLSLLPFASAIISRLSIYATLIIAARTLDSEQFGVYAVCMVIIGLLAALVTGGGDMWLNRFTGQIGVMTGQAPRLWPVYFLVVLTISVGLLAVVVLVEVTELVPDKHKGIPLATAVAAVLSGVSEALLAIMRAGGSLRLFFLVRDIGSPLVYLGLLAFADVNTALDAMMLYVYLWGSIFFSLALRLLWRAPQMLPAIRPPLIALFPVTQHTVGLIYGNLTSRLATHADVLVLTSFVSIVALGEYRVAAQFAIGFMVIQHFVFLGLPWEMRYSRSRPSYFLGLSMVANRQRLLITLGALGGGLLWLGAMPLLALLGERFVDVASIFRLLLITRFASLLWGPQHELLISNGLPTQDANANLASLGVWTVSFFSLQQAFGALDAAVAANVLSVAAAHIYRLRILRKHRLPEIYGHPFGPAAPMVLSLAVLVAGLW
jgi:O-antigen/teichoic acid export membrane protein